MRGLTEIRGLAGQAAEPLLDIAGWESGYWAIDYIAPPAGTPAGARARSCAT